jgi:hypothetical protein
MVRILQAVSWPGKQQALKLLPDLPIWHNFGTVSDIGGPFLPVRMMVRVHRF